MDNLQAQLSLFTLSDQRGVPPAAATLTAPVRLSPSDFAFLWEECRRCFYLKYVRGVARPRAPFPSVFTKIDLTMKSYFGGRSTAEVSADLPPGELDCRDQLIRSEVITVPGRRASCYIVGRCDSVMRFHDGAFGVIDFKTAAASEERIALYSRQVHAYAYALEHPTHGSPHLAPVTHLGLLCVEPKQMLCMTGRTRHFLYVASPVWLPFARNDSRFMAFIDDVLSVLELPDPPSAASRCPYCCGPSRGMAPGA